MTQKSCHPLTWLIFVLWAVALASFMSVAGPAQAGTVGTWTPTGTLTIARGSHTATLLNNGQVLVAGGTGNDGKPMAICELYNPATGAWTARFHP